MTSGQTYTFELSNTPTTIGSVAYFTIEANATANQNLLQSQTVEGVFDGFAGDVTSTSLVTSSTGFSLSLFGGGEFTFTPSTTIPADSYYIKGTGRVGLQLS